MKYLVIVWLLSFGVLHAAYSPQNKAKVQLLNKLTGKYSTVILNSEKTYIFDSNLYLTLKKCYRSAEEDEIENISFIQITRYSLDSISYSGALKDIPFPEGLKAQREDGYSGYLIFSGWLYSSSPSLSFVEDSMYDVTLVRCLI